MSALPLAVSISLCLVFTLVVFFLREQARRPFGGTPRGALLPVAGETPRSESGERRRGPAG
ncbi:MAG TPA: hypothetical protein VLT83_09450 [Opitutaceae bacterium]|nr:hypothetical protein [Opitutaceae bacterium]